MLAWLTFSTAMAAAPPCAGLLKQPQVVECALAQNPEVRRARLELDALAGQRLTAGTWLPSNPVVQMSAGHRTPQRGEAPANSVGVDWMATLSQEIEIAGQRGVRLDQVDLETAGQLRRVAVAEREVTAAALVAYYHLVAAKHGLALAERVATLAANLEALADARAQQSLLAPVDADVAAAEALRLALTQSEAERRYAVAQATLAILLGVAESVIVEVADDFDPLPLPDGYAAGGGPGDLVHRALALRGEVAAAETESRVLEHQLSLLQRERIPNLTLSMYASQDSTTERVIGGGLSFPLTLPAPLGQSRAGQIAETLARIEQAKTDVALIQRRVRQEVNTAVADEKMTSKALARFRVDQVERAQRDLTALGEALTARQMTMREALLAQRSLIELLQSHLATRLAQALTRLELIRAAGLPFTGVRS